MTQTIIHPTTICGVFCLSLLAVAGCASHSAPQIAAPVATSPAAGQMTFDSPDAATATLVAAAKSGDRDAMGRIFGPDLPSLVSGDPQQDAHDFGNFSTHAAEHAEWAQSSPTSATLLIGKNDWPLPVPLVRSSPDGRWYFDTPAGRATVLARRVGHNELNTIAVCRTYVAAQRQYAAQYHDDSNVYEYAQRLTSRAGKHDGLYWPAASPDEVQSPFGPLAQQAAAEGYSPPKGAARAPFHGYYFRVLKSQGTDAPGGAYSYVINGHMIAGFALVAYPAQYGNTGVMTFIVSHSGAVHQKDLGPNTAEAAAKITAYDPDSSWSLVKD